jgi:hypothetical protein
VLRECQERVIALARKSQRNRILYDALEMDAPVVDVALSQRKLDEAAGAPALRRAIVVPDTKLAYLARLAFGEGDYRVFYSDMTAAIRWLSE